MKDYQKTTLQFYEGNIGVYIANTANLQDTDWLDRFTALLKPGARLLDLGCAYGRDCEYLVEHGFETYGIDLSPSMIRRARETVGGAKFEVMDMLDLQFQDAFFDAIWCSAVLLHIAKTDVPRALSECRRVLKDRGYLYLHVKLGTGEGIVKDGRYGGAEKFYAYFTEPEIRAFLEAESLRIVDLHVVREGQDSYRDTGLMYIVTEKA